MPNRLAEFVYDAAELSALALFVVAIALIAKGAGA